MRVTDALLRDVQARLPRGRHDPIPSQLLATDLGVSERTLQSLIHELRSRGVLVGSTSAAGKAGYFLCADLEDLKAGTEHLRSRAVSMLKPFYAMRRVAQAHFGDQGERLFSLDELEEASA